MRYLVAIVAVLLLVVGCGGSSAVPSSLQLERVEWRAVSIAGVPPLPKNVPTMTLNNGLISGSAGCNHYSGAARIEAGRLVVDQLAMTAMACLDNRANTLEMQFANILSSKPLIGSRGGMLVLQGKGGEVVFTSNQTTTPTD